MPSIVVGPEDPLGENDKVPAIRGKMIVSKQV